MLKAYQLRYEYGSSLHEVRRRYERRPEDHHFQGTEACREGSKNQSLLQRAVLDASQSTVPRDKDHLSQSLQAGQYLDLRDPGCKYLLFWQWRLRYCFVPWYGKTFPCRRLSEEIRIYSYLLVI